MTSAHIPIEPGEITIVLADDMNVLTHHACRTAKQFADKQVAVQLVNAGMMSRRFWRVARDEAPEHITDRHGSRFLRLRTATRGNLYSERSIISAMHRELNTKVLIISGWEWASKSWLLKESLIFHLRELAEETGMAIIVYSQARTSPKLGCIDRGGVGKLASIALSIVRIEEDEDEVKQPAEPVIISPQDEIEAEKFAQLVAKEINDLGGVRARGESLPQRREENEEHEEEEFEPEYAEEEMEFA